MRKIGILGYGKMGKEIFQFYYPQCKETTFIVYCRHDAVAHQQALERTLQKQLRRKRITEETYAFQQAHLSFTEDLQNLADCDLIIESITESLAEKQEIFAKLEQVVSADCLLLTNTSSLPIAAVFANVTNLSRCFGLHYFYPLKLTGFAELNLLPENNPDAVERVRSWVTAHGKQALTFYAPYHMYLNQFLFTTISTAIYFWQEGDCSVATWEAAWKPYFPIGGVFGLIDSIGLRLLTQQADAFAIERTKALQKQGLAAMRRWKDAGCEEMPNCVLTFLNRTEQDVPEAPLPFPAEALLAILMQEALTAVESCDVASDVLLEALQDTIGLALPFSDYAIQIGVDKLRCMVADLHKRAPLLFPEPADAEKWKIFNK